MNYLDHFWMTKLLKKKIMKKLIYLSTLILTFYSCSKPCPDYQSKTYNYLLSDSTKAQIPFIGKDTLTYISNKGDTAFLFGTEKFNYIDSKKVNRSGSPDCPQIDNYNYEVVSVRYEGNNPNLFSIFYSSNVDYNKQENTNTIINDISEYYGYTFNYNNTLSYTTPITIGNQIINGRNIDRKDGKPSFVYNKVYGILQIKMNDSLTYTLNK